MNRLFLVLGLGTLGYGIFLIVAEHSRFALCDGGVNSVSGLGMNDVCQNIVASYYLGFVLAVIGIMLSAFGVLAMKKNKGAKYRTRPSEAPLERWWEKPRSDGDVN